MTPVLMFIPALGQHGSAPQASPERAFLSGMIAPHEGALGMARLALPTLKDPGVRAWAEAVLKEQEGEIRAMRAPLPRFGGMGQGAYQARVLGMADRLAKPRTAWDRQQAFVEPMLLHHKGAVEVLLSGRDKGVLDLAKAIALAQTEGIHRFNLWLL